MTDSPGVCLAWIHGGTVSGWFAQCIANMLVLDARLDRHIIGDKGDQIVIQSSPRIHEARNQVVDHFASLEQQPEWLLMLDTDMTFQPDLVYRLLAAADPVERPVVGGLCFRGGRIHEPLPTLYKLTTEEHDGQGYYSLDVMEDYPRDQLVPVGATGAACLLVHRQVFATMQHHFGELSDGRKNPSPWFAEGVFGPKGENWGEDTTFCLRANALKIPIHVHTGIKIGHIKEMVVDEVYYDNRREVVRQDELMAKVAGNGDRAERRRAARAAS